MPRNVDDIINELSPARRKKVEARAAQLIAEEMTLQQLRHARKLTQQKIAKSLHIGQEGVSKLEQRSDLLISTLRDYVEAMGGNLSLVAEFPDREPVVLSGITENDPKPKGRKHAHAHEKDEKPHTPETAPPLNRRYQRLVNRRYSKLTHDPEGQSAGRRPSARHTSAQPVRQRPCRSAGPARRCGARPPRRLSRMVRAVQGDEMPQISLFPVRQP